MKEKKKTKRAFNKGITLIALVITIIVLLILAGVSIATLTGDNGILTKAQTTKEETKKASEEEQIQLAAMNAAMNTERYNYKVEDGTVPIPAGFAPTQIEGQNSIKDGVVVVDEKGNEFVWIPCTLEEFNKQRNNEENGWSSKQWYYNGGTWGDSQPNKDEIQNSIKSEDIGGFYIGRYEAGVPKEATEFYANSDGAPYKQSTEKNADNSYIPVSKRGVQAWTYIDQAHAKDAAERMISNNGVQSYLIDSHAWDTTCRIIKKYDKTKNLLDSTEWGNYKDNTTTKYENLNTLYALHTNDNGKWDIADHYSKGQVKGAPKGVGINRLELSTGASEDFKAYNIYDLAGNMWEWTTENGNNIGNKPSEAMPDLKTSDIEGAKNGVFRGGGFDADGGYSVVGSHGVHATSECDFCIGFRVVLYLQ